MTARLSVEELLTEARAELARVTPAEADRLRRAGALLVDIRPAADRAAEGGIPGAVAVERIVLEWRLDPRGADRLDGFDEHTTVIVFCNEGYASSLAARDLHRLGVTRATDLVGGFRAWRAAGLPVCPPTTPPAPDRPYSSQYSAHWPDGYGFVEPGPGSRRSR